jgi:hypothetical protein
MIPHSVQTPQHQLHLTLRSHSLLLGPRRSQARIQRIEVPHRRRQIYSQTQHLLSRLITHR